MPSLMALKSFYSILFNLKPSAVAQIIDEEKSSDCQKTPAGSPRERSRFEISAGPTVKTKLSNQLFLSDFPHAQLKCHASSADS